LAPDVEEHFGLLRCMTPRAKDSSTSARTPAYARIGEGSLIYGRYSGGRLLRAAAMEEPEDPQRRILGALLAAAGQTEGERERAGGAALAHGTFRRPTRWRRTCCSVCQRARADSARRTVLPQTHAAVSDPVAAAPHGARPRSFSGVHARPRSGDRLSAGCGIGKRSQDLYWLARAC
jgi:hypothetical protein